MNLIIIENYNLEWPKTFEKIKQSIWPSLKDYAISIEHVGSTSVPGLSAKPVIDIDIVVTSAEAVKECISSLTKLGYVSLGEMGVPGREAFRRPAESPKHNLYVCFESSVAFKNHITLRDFLRKNDIAKKQYAELKIKLAKQFAGDIDGYCEAKTSFIISILKHQGLSQAELDEIVSANTI